MITKTNTTLIKKLRDKTGAGIMLCKLALNENKGNFEKALAALRLKDEATASKKSIRTVKEGVIDAYIHTGSRLGVLLEINCETDFVARQEEFKTLVRDIAMQIASSENIEFIHVKDISNKTRENEWKFEEKNFKLSNTSEVLKNKIIEERVSKSLKSKVLLEQNFIKNPKITIKSLIEQNITLFGENIRITRFVKFKLGE